MKPPPKFDALEVYVLLAGDVHSSLFLASQELASIMLHVSTYLTSCFTHDALFLFLSLSLSFQLSFQLSSSSFVSLVVLLRLHCCSSLYSYLCTLYCTISICTVDKSRNMSHIYKKVSIKVTNTFNVCYFLIRVSLDPE